MKEVLLYHSNPRECRKGLITNSIRPYLRFSSLCKNIRIFTNIIRHFFEKTVDKRHLSLVSFLKKVTNGEKSSFVTFPGIVTNGQQIFMLHHL
ncbi:unnamed protein product (plasmid) [Klebsiella pneumoniae]|nr:unnamed protein product [Klebsiella pneumoniae]